MSKTGVISGSPTELCIEEGMYTIAARCSDTGSIVTTQLSLAVWPKRPQVRYSPEMVQGRVGEPFRLIRPVSNTGGEVERFEAPELPAGLILNPRTGELSGLPTEALDKGALTIIASNRSGQCQCQVLMKITPRPTTVHYNTDASRRLRVGELVELR
jgi:hypothetical protein